MWAGLPRVGGGTREGRGPLGLEGTGVAGWPAYPDSGIPDPRRAAGPQAAGRCSGAGVAVQAGPGALRAPAPYPALSPMSSRPLPVAQTCPLSPRLFVTPQCGSC